MVFCHFHVQPATIVFAVFRVHLQTLRAAAHYPPLTETYPQKRDMGAMSFCQGLVRMLVDPAHGCFGSISLCIIDIDPTAENLFCNLMACAAAAWGAASGPCKREGDDALRL